MIRSAPSISTTGQGGRLDDPEVRDEVGLARDAQLLEPLVRAHLGEDVGGRVGHVGSGAVSVEVRPVVHAAGHQGVHRAPVPAACYFPAVDPPAAARAPCVPEPARQRVLQARRRAALPRVPRRAGRRAHQRAGRPRLQRVPRLADRDVRLPRARGRPRGPDARCSSTAEAWLRRHGLRPHDRPDGLHDERRERHRRRGPRARADDPPAVAPAVLPAARARTRAWRRRSTCSCGSSRSATAPSVRPAIFDDRRARAGAPRA